MYVTTKLKVSFLDKLVQMVDLPSVIGDLRQRRTKNPAIAKVLQACKEKEKGISKQRQWEKERCHHTRTYEAIGNYVGAYGQLCLRAQ